MNDTLRESLSYPGLYSKMFRVKKIFTPEKISFGPAKEQYFLYYEPHTLCSDKIVFWVHGGGWNAGSPHFFDFVGQYVAGAGYRFVSVGYRHSPGHKYPSQLEDVCRGFRKVVDFLREKGVDTSKIVVSGPSAGAHLSALLCYAGEVPAAYGINREHIVGFIGAGGPYSFGEKLSLSLRLLLDQLFEKQYDRALGEPCARLEASNIPMLLIHSRHDGLIDYACAEKFCEKARRLGIPCTLYAVEDKKNTHSWYTAGMFLETREENRGLDTFFSWIEQLP